MEGMESQSAYMDSLVIALVAFTSTEDFSRFNPVQKTILNEIGTATAEYANLLSKKLLELKLCTTPLSTLP